MATPRTQPCTVRPLTSTAPEVGLMRPETIRSSVDLPEPERPSRLTISPSRRDRSTFSSTASSPPPGLGKAWQTDLACSRRGDVVLSMANPPSVETQATLRKHIEPPPEAAVEKNHEYGHHGNAQHDSRVVALGRCLGDI